MAVEGRCHPIRVCQGLFRVIKQDLCSLRQRWRSPEDLASRGALLPFTGIGSNRHPSSTIATLGQACTPQLVLRGTNPYARKQRLEAPNLLEGHQGNPVTFWLVAPLVQDLGLRRLQNPLLPLLLRRRQSRPLPLRPSSLLRHPLLKGLSGIFVFLSWLFWLDVHEAKRHYRCPPVCLLAPQSPT